MDRAASGNPPRATLRRGWEGAALRVLGARDFRLTVLESVAVTERYHRLVVDDGGLLASRPPHPTMWIRLWFPGQGRAHQRAYTLVDPDVAAGRFALEFAVHDGTAARWALAARPGDTVEATVQGSRFRPPDPAPAHCWVVGDLAAVPAVKSLLGTPGPLGTGPATVWLEHAHDAEPATPLALAGQAQVTWVPRERAGDRLVETVVAALAPPALDPRRDYAWVAAEARTTRTIAGHLRRALGMAPDRICATAYWRAG